MNSFRSRRGSGHLTVEVISNHLKEAAEELLAANRVPLEEHLRQSDIYDCSVEEQYGRRQEETTQMWQLLGTKFKDLVNAIQALERQEIELSFIREQLEGLKEEHYRKTTAMQEIIEHYRTEQIALEERVAETERQLLQTNEERQTLEQFYQEKSARRTSLSNRCLPEPTPTESLEVVVQKQNEFIFLEMKIKQLQTELCLKEEMVGEKEIVKNELAQKLKVCRQRLNTIENANHILQQSNLQLADDNFLLRQELIKMQQQMGVLTKWNQCLETRATEGEEEQEDADCLDRKGLKRQGTLFPVNSEKVIRYFDSSEQKNSLAVEIGAFYAEVDAQQRISQKGCLLPQSESLCFSEGTGPSPRNPSRLTTPSKSPREYQQDKDIVKAVVEICRRCSSKKLENIGPAQQSFSFTFNWMLQKFNTFCNGTVRSRIHRKRVGHFSVL